MSVIQYRVNTYKNNNTGVTWFILESSGDGGATWAPVQGPAPVWRATNGYIMSQTQATIVTEMNSRHSAVLADVGNTVAWTIGPVVAGPV